MLFSDCCFSCIACSVELGDTLNVGLLPRKVK